jgi:catechol 2,3-dioxygenase
MEKQFFNDLTISTVTYRVKDLNKMKRYYNEVIGLHILKDEEVPGIVELGMKGEETPLLILDGSKDYKLITGSKNGLYHTAWLLPSRAALGDVLYRMLLNRTPLSGASDHAYSEALYLQDPEDNGIEIYADRDSAGWTHDANGGVVGVTEAMDAEGVLASRSSDEPQKFFPNGTIIGHLHLSSDKVEEFFGFLRDELQLVEQMGFPGNVHFTSYSNYHHHVAINTWGSEQMVPYADDQTGLAAYTLTYHNEDLYKEIVAKLKANNRVVAEEENLVTAKDANGVTVYVAFK